MKSEKLVFDLRSFCTLFLIQLLKIIGVRVLQFAGVYNYTTDTTDTKMSILQLP